MDITRPARLAIIATILAVVSCSQEPQSTDIVPAGEVSRQVESIQWFDGSVDDAFAVAKSAGKPIYLYWGAEWCPPCHAISATVFRSAEFIARSQFFVAVYLDGDDENAQAQGEKFNVLGYPTMIVFDPDGVELTRIPGGIDIQAYANILDLTLDNVAPVSDLIEAVIPGEFSLSDEECRLLAYYSWGQNPDLLEDHDEVETFGRIYDACPADMHAERSLVYMKYLDELIDSLDGVSEKSTLSPKQIEQATEVVYSILASPDLVRANIFSVIFDGAKMTRMLTETGSADRARMIDAFNKTMDELAADETVYKRERIYAYSGKVFLEQIDDDSDAEISDELRNEIETAVAWADQSTPDQYERQAIINAVSNLLSQAGMNNIAKPLLMAELEKSNQPYYFMVALADIEQEAGNYEKALEWLKEAYDVSTGPATRFQWGYYYLSGLLEMAPEKSDLIQSATIDVVRELEAGAGFYQRPKAQIGRLERKLLDWSEETDQAHTIDAIRTDMLTVCGNFADQQDSFETCQSFLDSA